MRSLVPPLKDKQVNGHRWKEIGFASWTDVIVYTEVNYLLSFFKLKYKQAKYSQIN